MDGKKKPSHASECRGEKKQCGCNWQPVRSEHAAHNNQSTPDRDKSDDDMQNGESADRHP
jgi:uncharacterized metal-binding protein YceD (DUF177 family)